jgi:hypothetical protein
MIANLLRCLWIPGGPIIGADMRMCPHAARQETFQGFLRLF